MDDELAFGVVVWCVRGEKKKKREIGRAAGKVCSGQA